MPRRLKLLILLVVVVGGAIFWLTRDSQHHVTDEQIRTQLSQREFSLQQLATLAKRHVEPSDSLDITHMGVFEDGEPENITAEMRVLAAVREFEKGGLQPMRFVFKSSRRGTDYFQADFPGCRPGNCSSTAKTVKITSATKQDRDDLQLRMGRSIFIRFGGIVMDGIRYRMNARIFLDAFGRALVSNIVAYRDFQTDFEKFMGQLAGGKTEKRVYWRRTIQARSTTTQTQ